MSRRNVSGNSHRAQSDAGQGHAGRQPGKCRWSRDRQWPASRRRVTPRRIPVKTQVLENEMTAPRRSGGDFHWRMAFNGHEDECAGDAECTHQRNVPDNGGRQTPSKSKARKTPMAPNGISPYSTRFVKSFPPGSRRCRCRSTRA